MGVPTPTIPSFTDGTVVHQSDLNALASNLTNLYNYNQAGFFTQRPCVLVKQTSAQTITSTTDTLINFQSALVNTDNMWTASVATQITIQHGGIYWLFGGVRLPPISGASLNNAVDAEILVNGTSPANAVAVSGAPMVNPTRGYGIQIGTIANLATNATVFLDLWQNAAGSIVLGTDGGSSFMGAVFLTPST